MSHDIDKERAAINIASSYIEKALNRKSQLLSDALNAGSQYLKSKMLSFQKKHGDFDKNSSFVGKIIKNPSDQERTR